jgi:hypothetical protein
VRRARVRLAIALAAYAGACALVLMSGVLAVGGVLSVPPVGAVAIGAFVIVHFVLGATVWSLGVYAVPLVMPILAWLLRMHIPPDSDIPEYADLVFLVSVVVTVPAISLIAVGSIFACWRSARLTRGGVTTVARVAHIEERAPS